MRVVFLSAARQVWGAEVSLLTLSRGLADAGVTQAIVCPEGELATSATAAGIEGVHPVTPRSEAVDQGRMRESLRLWQRCLQVVRPGDTLVIFSYYLLALLPAVRPVLRRRGVHVALDLHDDFTSPKARAVLRAGSTAVDTVIACSRFTAAQLPHHPRISSLHRPVGLSTPPEVRADGSLDTTSSLDASAELDPVARARVERSARAHAATRQRARATDAAGRQPTTARSPPARRAAPRPRPPSPRGCQATASARCASASSAASPRRSGTS